MHFEQYLNQGWFIKSRGELPKLGVMCPETEAQLIPINWTWTGVGEMRPFSWSLKLPFLSAERFTQVRQHKGARALENTPLCFYTLLSIPYVWYQAPCCPLTMLFACVTSKKRPKLTVSNPPLPLPREVLRLTQKVRCRKWTLFWIQVRLHNCLSCELTYIFLLDYNYSPSS